MSLAYIRKTYNVPAQRGRRVTAYGKPGVIVGASGSHVSIRLDGEKTARSYHPTDGIDYDARGPWLPITAERPAPLDDVMVSVFTPGDDEPVVYMAYRKPDGQFYLSGTFDQVVRGAYAWASVMDAAPAPAAQRVAA